ncbi:hypothetical protein EKO29_04490 [Colwellia sp. Arc7-635]|uniref:hypothetical protein n=1 Tax=Colwellia sp. Arc7-635 TaxID=2497879 RepID=UPI000F857779|nr:hypothetical protein [Colwellia sp. Arc7-635]AZQ83374.1 hypothetical protein EKO29_04490 [Colwellia sp. Arc7-635]
MLSNDAVKQYISDPEINQKDKVMLCLAIDVSVPKPIKEITQIGIQCGYTGIKKLNVSSILSRQSGLVIRSPSGWELTEKGKAHIKSIIGGPVAILSSTLRSNLSGISNSETRVFVEEAVQCFEVHFYRAAVVLSWVGAISVLYNHVLVNHKQAFNSFAAKKNPKWKPANTSDDLTRMKEADFLEVCETASIIGKSVKQELQTALTFRNGCGHPNSLKLGEHRVSAHIESLILNVYSQY